MADDEDDSGLPVKVGINLTDLAKQVSATKLESKEQYFAFLRIPLGSYDLEMDSETAEKFKNSMISLKTGLHARVPMICPGGVKCPVGRRCDFTKFVMDVKTGKPRRGSDSLPIIDTEKSRWPLFQSCPYENTLIAMRITDLCMEYNVDPTETDNITDLSIISKIAELDIYDARASQILANESIVLDEVTGFEFTGNPQIQGKEISTKKLHPAFELKEKIHKMRQELIRAMVGDRQSKVKAQAALGTTQSRGLTDIMDDMRRRINRSDNQVIDAEVIEIHDEDEDTD